MEAQIPKNSITRILIYTRRHSPMISSESDHDFFVLPSLIIKITSDSIKNFLNSASVARSPRSRSHCGSLGSQKFWNGPPGRELGFKNCKWLEIDCISFVDIQSIGTSLRYSFWLLQIEFGDFQPLNYIGSPNSLIWTWLCLVNFGPWLDFIGTWNLDSNLIFFTYIQCRLHKKLEMNCVSCRKRIVPFQFGEWQD